jgi:tetratricopeptide (TPR) repeat protein
VLGKVDDAMADYSKALELNPKLAQAWYLRALGHVKRSEHEKAISDLSRFIEVAAGHPLLKEAYAQRAHCHYQLKHFGLARDDFLKLPKLAPTDALIHNALGWLFATAVEPSMRDSRQAVTLARKAVELAPKEGNYWNTLGVAHYRAGDWKACVAALDKARDLRGSDPIDWFFLAMAHHKLGNDEQSSRLYARAIRWLERHKSDLAKNPARAEELRRFRSEAEQALERKQK